MGRGDSLPVKFGGTRENNANVLPSQAFAKAGVDELLEEGPARNALQTCLKTLTRGCHSIW